MTTSINAFKENYNAFFTFSSDISELFDRALPNSIIRDYLFASVTAPDGEERVRAKGAVKQFLGNLITYGCVDYILWFALFLDRYDPSANALKELYQMLGEKTVFEKPMTEWCDEFISKYHSLGNLTSYKYTSDFICNNMLGLQNSQSANEIITSVQNKVSKNFENVAIATPKTVDAYKKLQCLGYLQYVMKHHDTNHELCAILLKKLFDEMDASALPKTQTRIAILSALLEAYTDALISLSSSFKTQKINGLGRSIMDFADDTEHKNEELIKYLLKNKANEWQSLLCYAMCQAASEGDYDTSSKLIIRHYEYSRKAQRDNARLALLETYLSIADDSVALSLFGLIKREQQRDSSLFTDAQNSAIDERFFNVVDHFVNENQSNIRKIKESTDVSNEDQIDALQRQSDLYAQVTSFFPQGAFFEQKLRQSMNAFLTGNNIAHEDLLNKLGQRERKTVIQYLRQGEMIYSLLEMLEGNRQGEEMYSNMDYSPALLQLTKALEYICNMIYKKISSELVLDFPTFRTQSRRRLENITLGNFQSLFSQDVYNAITYTGRKPNPSYTYLSDIVDVTKYRCPSRNASAKRERIYRDLNIPREYRNNAAHKDPLKPEQYTNCEKCLFDRYSRQSGNSYQEVQHLLWKILYMIKDGIVLTE